VNNLVQHSIVANASNIGDSTQELQVTSLRFKNGKRLPEDDCEAVGCAI